MGNPEKPLTQSAEKSTQEASDILLKNRYKDIENIKLSDECNYEAEVLEKNNKKVEVNVDRVTGEISVDHEFLS